MTRTPSPRPLLFVALAALAACGGPQAPADVAPEPRPDASAAFPAHDRIAVEGAEPEYADDYADDYAYDEEMAESEEERMEQYVDAEPTATGGSGAIALESAPDFGGLWGGRRATNVQGPAPIDASPPEPPTGTTLLMRDARDDVGRCPIAPESAGERYVFYVDPDPLWSADGIVQRAPGDTVAIVQVDAIAYPDQCTVLASGSPLRLDALGIGGLMLLNGPVPADLMTPDQAFATPGVEIVELYGWQIVGGRWVTTGEPVVAALDTAPEPAVCVSPMLREHLSDIARTWVHHRIGLTPEPPTRDVAETIDTRFPADRVLLAHFSDDAPDTEIAPLCAADDEAQWVSAFVGQHDARVPATLTAAHPTLAAAAALVEYDRGDALLGQSLLDDVLDANPVDPLANLVAGMMLIDEGDALERAEEHLVVAAEATDYRGLAHYHLGRIYEELGDVASATRAYETALDASPTLADAANALGFLYYLEGDPVRAEALFRDAVHHDPAHANAYGNLGYLLERERADYTGAEAAYVRATEIAPLDPVYHYNLGYLYEAFLGRLSDAEREYETAVRLLPDYGEASDALTLLRARPEASEELLVGLWSTPETPGLPVDISRTVSFEEGGVYRVVERRVHTDPGVFVWDMRWSSEPADRSQLRVVFSADDEAEVYIIEFVDADTIIVFDPTAPGTSRSWLTRHVGDDHAGARHAPRL